MSEHVLRWAGSLLTTDAPSANDGKGQAPKKQRSGESQEPSRRVDADRLDADEVQPGSQRMTVLAVTSPRGCMRSGGEPAVSDAFDTSALRVEHVQRDVRGRLERELQRGLFARRVRAWRCEHQPGRPVAPGDRELRRPREERDVAEEAESPDASEDPHAVSFRIVGRPEQAARAGDRAAGIEWTPGRRVRERQRPRVVPGTDTGVSPEHHHAVAYGVVDRTVPIARGRSEERRG